MHFAVSGAEQRSARALLIYYEQYHRRLTDHLAAWLHRLELASLSARLA